MNYNHLWYFKEVAELLHFTKAADNLYISQPALSRSISQLEFDLGVRLFDKVGRNVTLTAAGEFLYNQIIENISGIDNGIEETRKLSECDRQTIRIAAMHSMYANYLPELILRHKKNAFNTKFHLEYKGTSQIIEEVAHDKFDFGICSDFELETAPKSLERFPVRTEKLVFISGKNHKLVDRQNIELKELIDEKFVVYLNTPNGLNAPLKKACHRAGFEPNIVIEGYNDYGVFGHVSAGEGISIVSEKCGASFEQVVILDVVLPQPFIRHIYLIWNNEVEMLQNKKEFRSLLIQDAEDYAKKNI